jgi:glycosyltransferase involved in cell wall biosynthesis
MAGRPEIIYMQNQTISAVIAVYNPKAELFRRAVLSVLSQTLPVLELVLVNDGGGEEFRAVLPDDSRIRIFSKPNGGVADTRNFALEQCRGDYIAFLDQDDFWYPDKLAEQVSMIARKGEPCLVVSPVDVVDASGRMVEKKSERVLKKYLSGVSGNDLPQALADDNFIHSSAPLVHREVFSAVGGFDDATRPHDDWDMYLRITLAGFPVHVYTKKPLSVWRMHEGNESQKRMAMMRSKCVVEEKALLRGISAEIESIVHSNLELDKVIISNLWYNEGDFREFRATMRRDLPNLLRRYLKSGRSDRFAGEFRRRAGRLILKSSRRYVISLFLRQAG